MVARTTIPKERLTPAQVEAFRDGMRHLASKGTDLAGYFARIGCYGRADSPGRCPVSRYLSKRTSRTVLVGTRRATLVGTRSVSITSPLPDNVRAFVKAFDSNRHPELER